MVIKLLQYIINWLNKTYSSFWHSNQPQITRFPNRSATLCGDSQAVKTMKNTAEVCHAAGGAKPPKSWLLHKG